MSLRSVRRSWALSILAAVEMLATSDVANAQAPQVKEAPARAIGSVQGKDNFDASALKGPIPDLTTIARRNGGKFDGLAIERVISGSDRNGPGHGSLDMPVWGPVFRTAQSDAAAAVRLSNLVRFLESIQQK